MIVVRRQVVAVVAAAAVTLTGAAATGATVAHASDTGFRTVGDVTLITADLASAKPGSVYVVGLAPDASTHLQLRTTTSTKDVRLPDDLYPRSLVAFGGHAYLLSSRSLYRIDGTTLVPVPMPTIPGTTALEFSDMRSDGTHLWLSGTHYLADTDRSALALARFDGRTWSTWSSQASGITRTVGGQLVYARGTQVALEVTESGYDGPTGAILFDGSTWSEGGRVSSPKTTPRWTRDLWTGPALASVTQWGDAGALGAEKGYCTAPAGAGCVPPAYGVRHVTELSDGTVVFGGFDSSTAQGGFALVRRQGATPVPVSGDAGLTVVDLETDADGRSAWAVANLDGSFVLEQASFGAAPTPTPTVVPTPRPTSHPTRPPRPRPLPSWTPRSTPTVTPRPTPAAVPAVTATPTTTTTTTTTTTPRPTPTGHRTPVPTSSLTPTHGPRA